MVPGTLHNLHLVLKITFPEAEAVRVVLHRDVECLLHLAQEAMLTQAQVIFVLVNSIEGVGKNSLY